MKHFLLSSIFTLLTVGASAQTWFTEHPVWNNYFTYFIWGNPQNGIEVARITGDTVIGGFPAQKILRKRTQFSGQSSTTMRFVRQMGTEILVWGGNSQYHRQYDFSLAVGDSLDTEITRYYIDSVGTLSYNGHEFRFQRIKFAQPIVSSNTCEVIVIEGIGAVSGTCNDANNTYSGPIYTTFFLDEPDLSFVDGPQFSFCAYRNDLFSYQPPSPSCAAIVSVADDITEQRPFITPNPFQDILHIQVADDQQVEQVRLYDLYGKVVVQQTGFSDMPLNTSQLAAGLYFLELYLNDGQHSMTKVVKTE